jgi:hypothetical protein
MCDGKREGINDVRNNRLLAALSLAFAALILGTIVPLSSFAQQVPPRGYQLQEYRRISPAPLSAAQRVKREVIKATNPRTGTVDVRILSRPDVPGPPWIGTRRSGTPQPLSTPNIVGPRFEGTSSSGTGQGGAVPPDGGPSFSSSGTSSAAQGARQSTRPKPLLKPMIPGAAGGVTSKILKPGGVR